MNINSITILITALVLTVGSACNNNTNNHTSSTGGGDAVNSGNHSNGGGTGGIEEYPSTGDDMVYPVCPDNTYEVSECPQSFTCTDVSICSITITCAEDSF